MLQLKTKRIILSICLLLLSNFFYAQIQTDRGWNFAINIGYYFPDHYNANYYNGSDDSRNPINRIISEGNQNLNPDDVFYNNNYQFLKENVFGGYDFKVAEFPQNMKYNNVMSYGFNIRYLLSEYISIFGDFNVCKLETVDIFTIEVLENRNISHIKLDQIEQFGIAGEESRVNFNIGLQMILGDKKVRPFIEAGLNLNNVKVKKNQIEIGGNIYDIYNPEDRYYNIEQGGIGTGVFTGGGLKFYFAKNYTIDLGMNFYMAKFKLIEPYKYQFEKMIFLRLGIDLKSKKQDVTNDIEIID